MTNREKLHHEWVARIADYRASGLTISAWCTANQCTIHQLKYWLYKSNLGSSSVGPTPTTRWVPLKVADPPTPPVPTSTLVVRVGQASIELRAGFDPELLREVVQALEAPC